MKKKILSLVLVAALALTAVGSTLAYFTDVDSAENVFTVGNIDIELHEKNDGNDQDEDYRKWLKEQNIVPNVPVAKNVWVKNVGKNSAYVQVTIDVPTDMTATMGDLADWTVVSPEGENPVYTGKIVLRSNTPVEPDAETALLMTDITLNPEVTSATASGQYDVPVLVEAIQSEGFENAEDAYTALAAHKSTVVSSNEAASVIANAKAGETVVLNSGNYSIKSVAEGVTIVGGGDAKIDLPENEGPYSRLNAKDVMIQGVTFTEPVCLTGNATFVDCVFEKGTDTCTMTGDVTFRNCTFNDNGKGFSLHIDSGDKVSKLVVDNCDFKGGAVAFKNIDSATFTDCDFAGTYNWKYMRAYNPLTLEDCTFASGMTVKAVDGAKDNVTLINTDVTVE